MDTSPLCPNCGKPLPLGAPKGLCPACLMLAAFPTGTDAGGKTPRFTPPTVAELTPKFPQLEILEFIGQGGMGAVYKARQKELDRIVALKILPPDIGHDSAFAERFTREAKALAKLNHPGIVTIHDSGRADGLYFFLMEFVDGVNLRQLLATSRVSTREALAIVPQICEALQFAHDQGIVHRDIKPENILLDRRGRVKVADFGLAKIMGGQSHEPVDTGSGSVGSTTLTEASKVMGTPQYMSPEQIKAPGEVDHRADIYALGVVFYQMLTGELPGKRLEPPSTKVHIDVRLDEVVLRALEKNPERRYQQVSEVKTMVETIVAAPDFKRKPDQPDFKKPEIVTRFSRTAIVGVCFGIPGLLAFVLNAVIGDSNLLDVGPSNVLATLCVLCLLISSILGWVAVALIRRPALNLRGIWLAVLNGLLFPLLALDALITFLAANLLGTFNDLETVFIRLGLETAADERIHWLVGIASAFICIVSNTMIVWGVWRAVNKRGSGDSPAGSENSIFGKWAWGPFLAGTLGSSLPITILPWPEGLAAAFGSLALALALVWGLKSWRERMGKVVVSATSVLFVASVVVAAVFWFVIVPAKHDRLQASFGPVTECTLPMDENGWTPLWDIDHNQFVRDPKPSDTAVMNVEQHLAPLKKPGMAIHYDGQIHIIAVSGITMTKPDGDQWEKITDMGPLAGPDGYCFLGSDATVPGSWQTCDFPNKLPQTIFFKTGTSKLGLLQIAGITDNPRGVKIRYKLVQNRNTTTTSVSLPSAAAPKLAFGPVIDRTLAADKRGLTDSLSLDSGEIISPLPAGTTVTSTEMSLPNFPETPPGGISFSHDAKKLLATGDTDIKVVTQASWEAMLPEQIQAEVGQFQFTPGESIIMSDAIQDSEMPKVFVFKTRTGGMGLLQITGFTDNPSGVKIRYKLVQNDNEQTPTPTTATPDLFFGPVMEQLFPDSKDPTVLNAGNSESSTNSQVMINYDSGELFIGAKDKWVVHKQAAIGTRSALYNSNIALGSTPQLNGVVGLDTAIFPGVNKNWDEIKVNSIVEHFYNAQIMSIDRYPAAYNTPLSSIWIFRTSEGSMGTIQILGFTENPRGMKLRYKLVQQNAKPEVAQVDDEVARLKLQIANSELEIAKKKLESEVVSQAASELSVSNIVALMQRAYASIYTYRDTGWTVTQTGEYVWTNKFTELLNRRKLYRIKVVTAQNPFSQTNRWWSDGETEFWQQGTPTIFKNSNPASETCNISLANQDSVVPALFYNLNWGNILKTMSYSPGKELVRRPDEVVSGVDCHVLEQTNIGLMVWIGKQDFLIRRYRNFISKERWAEMRRHSPNTNALPAEIETDQTTIQNFENVIVNEDLKRGDFIPPNAGTN